MFVQLNIDIILAEAWLIPVLRIDYEESWFDQPQDSNQANYQVENELRYTNTNGEDL